MQPRIEWLRGLAPTLLLLFSVWLTACAGGSGEPPSSQSSGPRAYYATDTVNFGRIPMGQTVRYIYIIKNTGGAPLVIKEVKLDLVEGC